MPAKDPYKYFRLEARELLTGLEEGAASLNQTGQEAMSVRRLLRLAHTLKGAARVVKLSTISELAHQMEGLLDPFREGKAIPGADERSKLDDLLGQLTTAVNAIDPTPPSPATARLESSAPSSSSLLDTVRLHAVEVDAALSGVSETSSELSSLQAEVKCLETSGQQARRIQLLAAQMTSGASARLAAEASEFAIELERTRQRLHARAERIGRDLKRLHYDTSRLRLIPVEVLESFLKRAVADAANLLGKQIRLEMISGASRLDAPIFANLQEALLHLVRNAVAHGIENEDERLAAGKEPEGVIRLSIEARYGRLSLTCKDDGRGIDTAAVRRAAIAKGWLPPEQDVPLSMEEAIALLLRGGISTATGADQVSGRGIGLDAASAAVSRFDGSLEIQSQPGQGAQITITAPACLSAVQSLVMEAGGGRWLLPMGAIREVLRIPRTEIRSNGGSMEMLWNGRALPYFPLAPLVNPTISREAEPEDRLSVAIVQGADGDAAIGVERLAGIQEVIVRPLPTLADAEPFIVGASLESAGPPQLLLDEDALITVVRGASLPATAETPMAPPILVIDDSLTTRMLEQSILESAGYQVDLAVSGEDALEKLSRKEYSLLLLDIEMPGIDGVTLLKRLRDEPAWRRLPVILVTSLESEEDRQRGLGAGAQDYIVKGEFDQRRLLKRIEELLS